MILFENFLNPMTTKPIYIDTYMDGFWRAGVHELPWTQSPTVYICIYIVIYKYNNFI